MTKPHALEHRRKRGRSPIGTAIKCGFGALGSLILTIASTAPADADDVTVILSKMDISIQPVDQPFSVRLTIQKDQDGNVTLDIPSITQTFDSSKNSPNVDPSEPFPAFWQPTPSGDSPSSNTYPPLPANYPLGGYIDRCRQYPGGISTDRRPANYVYALQQHHPWFDIHRLYRQSRAATIFSTGSCSCRCRNFCDSSHACCLYHRQTA